MSQENYIAKLFGMEEVIVENLEKISEQVRVRFHLPLRETLCPGCGTRTRRVHDYRVKVLRDLPLQGLPARLEYRRRRYLCLNCGRKFPEPFPLAGRNQRTTARLVSYGLELARERRSGKSIARELGVSAFSVNRWLSYLPKGKPPLLPRVLSIDEFRGNANHERFQCILTDPEKRKIVDILPDRTASTIQSYLKSFPNCSEVEYFVMDMNRAYLEIGKTFLPQAKIVVDRFHFVRCGVWAFENVRRRVQKKLSAAQRKYFKRSRKLLLARASSLSAEERQAVEVMLAHSEDLTRAWLLKEKFFQFADAENSREAKTRLEDFRYFARDLGLAEFRDCLRMLHNWEEYILNSFDCPFSNGFTEGMNNATKALKRVTFGMPNFPNFRARILLAASLHP